MQHERARAAAPWFGRVLATVVLILLALVAPAGVAEAADGAAPPTPTPYGGSLGQNDPGSQVDFDQVLEVAMLTVGTLNGLVFAGAVVASRIRGSSHAATRRALSSRTGRGRVSEAPWRSRSGVRPPAGAGREPARRR